jgi:F0F1-type ATP synthase membrane subunit c/vacuolar-type H+-ATPase subunit K
MLAFLGKLSLGLVMGFGGLGSCLGIRAAGLASAAAWAKEGKEGKPLSALFNAMVGMPVSQTLYCMILFFLMRPYAGVAENGGVLFGIAVGVGIAELFSAYCQGMIGSAGVRCLSENGGKGFGNIVVAMGIAESVGLFAMVVGILILNSEVMVKAAEVATAVAK